MALCTRRGLESHQNLTSLTGALQSRNEASLSPKYAHGITMRTSDVGVLGIIITKLQISRQITYRLSGIFERLLMLMLIPDVLWHDLRLPRGTHPRVNSSAFPEKPWVSRLVQEVSFECTRQLRATYWQNSTVRTSLTALHCNSRRRKIIW